MTDHALLIRDKHLIFDPRHPVDPITGAEVWTAWTNGFNNKLLMMHMANPADADAFKARLYSLQWDGAEDSYGEREIGEVFAAWGLVQQSRRRLYFYLVFSSLAEREFIRWKVFGKV